MFWVLIMTQIHSNVITIIKNSSSQMEVNQGTLQLQIRMNEIKTLQATLTQKVITPSEEGNSLRTLTSRPQEQVGTVTGGNRTTQTSQSFRKHKNDTDDEYDEPMRSPSGSLVADQLLTEMYYLPRKFHPEQSFSKRLCRSAVVTNINK